MKNYRLLSLVLFTFLVLEIIGSLVFLKVENLWFFGKNTTKVEAKIEPKEIDLVRIGLTWQVSIYPENSAENTTVGFNSGVFEPLAKFDETGQIIPSIAQSWDNPDNLTWRFYLSPKARFSDGSSVTADDVKFTYDYMKSHEFQMSELIPKVASVEVVDNKTIIFKSSSPDPVLLNRLATNLLIMSRVDVEQNGLKNHLGSGPYKIGRVSESEISFVRNDNYWQAKPKAREIVLKVIPDEAERLRALENNEIDIDMYLSDQKNISNLKIAVSKKELQLLRMSHNNGIMFLSLDTTRDKTPYIDLPQNPLKDLRVRKALEKGIDASKIAASIPSGARVADQLVSSGIFGFNPNIKRLPYDPEGARALLEQAGYKNGFSMTIDYLSVNPRAKITMDLVARQLALIGVEVKLNSMSDMDQYFAKTDGRDTTAYRSGYSADSKDACEVLSLIVHTPDANYGTYNLGYSNKQVDQYIAAAIQSTDPKTRLGYLQDAMKISMDEVAVIPLIEEMDLYGYSNKVLLRPRQDGTIKLEEIAGK